MTNSRLMPELCKHDDPSWCTAECEAKAKRFDKWICQHLKEETMASKNEITTRYNALDLAMRAGMTGELVATTVARAEAFLKFLSGSQKKKAKR